MFICRNHTLPSSLYLRFLLFQGTFVNFIYILTVRNFFLTTVIVLLIITKDSSDFIIKGLSTITNKKNLEGFFNRDSSFKVFVVHQELNDVEKFSWFKTSLVRYTSLVHCEEFIFVNITIKVIVDFEAGA